MKLFKRLFQNRTRQAGPSTGGRLVYAIGDIHGRLDLLTPLLDQIRNDAGMGADQTPMLIFLGDYIDRGPQSREVIECVRTMKQARDFEVRTLMGNHEQVMLSFLDDPTVGTSWVEFGGGETLTAYGVPRPALRSEVDAWIQASEALAKALPDEHLRFLRSLETSVTLGDYMFVHAGVRPSVALDAQEASDLLWIRHEFLENDRRLDKIIVHGHTPEVEPHLGRVRIGIDTGAYATGVLTAVRLSDSERAILQGRAVRG